MKSWELDDLNVQIEDQARAERQDYRDARDYEPDDRPSRAELAQMRYLDAVEERRGGRR